MENVLLRKLRALRVSMMRCDRVMVPDKACRTALLSMQMWSSEASWLELERWMQRWSIANSSAWKMVVVFPSLIKCSEIFDELR